VTWETTRHSGDGRARNERFLADLGGGWPGEAAVLPLLAGGHVVAVLYGDNLPGGRPIPPLEPLEAALAEIGRTMQAALQRAVSQPR